MRRVVAAALVGVTAMIAVPVAAQVPIDEVVAGPGHFCGFHFAVDLARVERMTRKSGPDFSLYFLEGPRGRFALYEGFAPDTSDYAKSAVELTGYPHIDRLGDDKGGHGYLITLPGNDGMQFYLHLFGKGWKGDESDLALIRRLKLGRGEAVGCPKDPS